ncbi:FIST N-terminal domain-containing protein, partial [Pseudomonas sp.]|uniref:FIST signal transduction protein n=1 Tax=Pseudomonas sp. TaxID=306 RepID=UPI0025844D58
MNPFRFLRQAASAAAGTASVVSTFSNLASNLQAIHLSPTFIAGFVSPHLDLDAVARQLRQRFPQATLSLCTTAGELSSASESLYCAAQGHWDRIVLQLFDASLIAGAEMVSVPLLSEDIRGNGKRLGMRDRIDRLVGELKRTRVNMALDSRDTLAYVLFDGLSASESFFMEALYESGRFPCLFVGGSSGGKDDFQKTLLHDGQRSYQNHAQIVFLKCAPNVRFGVFKSQNFEPTPLSFSVLTASLEERYIHQVFDAAGNIKTMVAALCDAFKCAPNQLEKYLAEYSFAIRVGEELFVRSIARIDYARETIHLFCDVAPGEELVMVKRTSLRD